MNGAKCIIKRAACHTGMALPISHDAHHKTPPKTTVQQSTPGAGSYARRRARSARTTSATNRAVGRRRPQLRDVPVAVDVLRKLHKQSTLPAAGSRAMHLERFAGTVGHATLYMAEAAEGTSHSTHGYSLSLTLGPRHPPAGGAARRTRAAAASASAGQAFAQASR
jgi:hypothetical protein